MSNANAAWALTNARPLTHLGSRSVMRIHRENGPAPCPSSRVCRSCLGQFDGGDRRLGQRESRPHRQPRSFRAAGSRTNWQRLSRSRIGPIDRRARRMFSQRLASRVDWHCDRSRQCSQSTTSVRPSRVEMVRKFASSLAPWEESGT